MVRSTVLATQTLESQDRSNAAGLRKRVFLLQDSARVRRIVVRCAIAGLLATHAGLLAYSATRHSPTIDEPAHLVAGISYWEFGRFDIYRVNPPLTRLVAALPVMVAGYEMNWQGYYEGPGARPEFLLGWHFLQLNGERAEELLRLARWACIPFSLIGGWVCFSWGRELYGTPSGFAAMALWCFDPNILAHGELVTVDVAATSLGLAATYGYWRWLTKPSWPRAIMAGVLLGLAELTKMSWLILFGLWPVLWLIWHSRARRHEGRWKVEFVQLVGQLTIAVYLLNCSYAFDGSLTSLGKYHFVSRVLGDTHQRMTVGNRFRDHWLGSLPVPLPKDYLLGLDTQTRDLEEYRQSSYLRGEWKQGGWWHYYLHGLAVKVPHTTQLLFLIAILSSIASYSRNEVVLQAVPVSLFVLVSSQQEFNHHFRYVLPCFGFAFVLTGGLFRQGFGLALGRARLIVLATIVATSAASTLHVYPHQLAYFNELSGGPANGHRHLLHSNLDWGQDYRLLDEFAAACASESGLMPIAVLTDAAAPPMTLYPRLSFHSSLEHYQAIRRFNKAAYLAVSPTFALSPEHQHEISSLSAINHTHHFRIGVFFIYALQRHIKRVEPSTLSDPSA